MFLFWPTRQFLWVASLSLGFGLLALAQSPSHVSKPAPRVSAGLDPPLELSATVVSERYCASGRRDVMGNLGRSQPETELRLRIRLRYSNRGKFVVRLGRDCASPDALEIYEESTFGKPRRVSTLSQRIEAWAGNRSCFPEPQNTWRVIAPGDSYVTEVSAHVPALVGQSERSFDPGVRPGRRFLRLAMAHMWEGEEGGPRGGEARRTGRTGRKIGRASCRERVYVLV